MNRHRYKILKENTLFEKLLEVDINITRMSRKLEGNSLIKEFEESVRLNPHLPALIVEDGKIFTYAQLDAIANTLSHHVAAAVDRLEINMGDNDTPLVSLMMSRDIGVVASMLGILKAGGAYVPVDPAFPPDRQSYIFKHSRCHLLLADEECYRSAKSFGVDLPPTVVVVSSTGAPLFNSEMPLPDAAQIEASLKSKRADALTRVNGGLAYVLYTSGSTGNPKGVMVPQEGVVNIVGWFAEQLNVCPS